MCLPQDVSAKSVENNLEIKKCRDSGDGEAKIVGRENRNAMYLKHFQQNWEPVLRSEMRKNK